jgi:Sec-independent protein secretion pathway component TatC
VEQSSRKEILMDLLRIAAFVLFVVGAILAFLVEGTLAMGLLFAGLACWVGAELFGGRLRG